MHVCRGDNQVLCTHRLMQIHVRGSLRTSHLLLYPSLWLLIPRLSSQFLPLFPIQPAFNVNSGRQDL